MSGVLDNHLCEFDHAFLRAVSTLFCLEEGTCSWRATKTFLSALGHSGDHIVVKTCESFYKARDLALATLPERSILLIPHFHPIVNSKLTYTEKCKLHPEVHFSLLNPPIYLATNDSMNDSTNDSMNDSKKIPKYALAAIHELNKLLNPEDEMPRHNTMEAQNTQHAARAVIKGEAEFCITNQHAVALHGLKIVRELRELTVLWLCFEFAEEPNTGPS